MRIARAVGCTLALAACAGGPPVPAALDTKHEACASCRMGVSDPSLAAQLVAAGEESRFFDDIGCLARYLEDHPAGEAAAYVADHRTKEWVRATDAVYTRVAALETPMGSHVIAHADTASRDQDPLAREGVAVTAAELFGTALTREAKR